MMAIICLISRNIAAESSKTKPCFPNTALSSGILTGVRKPTKKYYFVLFRLAYKKQMFENIRKCGTKNNVCSTKKTSQILYEKSTKTLFENIRNKLFLEQKKIENYTKFEFELVRKYTKFLCIRLIECIRTRTKCLH